MFNFFLHETGAGLIWALVSSDPREFFAERSPIECCHEKWQLRYGPSRTNAHVQQFPNTATHGNPCISPHTWPPFDWRFHSARCRRSRLRARWRLPTGLFIHNNWDSRAECWTNPPPSCYTAACFYYISKYPLIWQSSKPFLIPTFLSSFFCNLQACSLGTLWQSFDQAVD